jgi:hypothetical protein
MKAIRTKLRQGARRGKPFASVLSDVGNPEVTLLVVDIISTYRKLGSRVYRFGGTCAILSSPRIRQRRKFAAPNARQLSSENRLATDDSGA